MIKNAMYYSLLFLSFLLIVHPLNVASNEQQENATPPRRIISLGPINTENIFLLGAQDLLVGNTSYCARPSEAKLIEKIGSVMQISIEKILSLRPDLVLATGLTQPRQISKLRSLGLKVVQFEQPQSFAAMCDQFQQLGQLLGRSQRAEQIISQARQKVNAVKELTASLPEQKVFLQIGSQPLHSSIKGSFTHDYIAMSNGINIAGDQDNGSMSVEKVIAEDPDVIIIAIMGSESGVAAQEQKKWRTFSRLQAVQNDRVHVIDPDLVCSPSPATFAETLAVMAILIHPEIARKNIL